MVRNVDYDLRRKAVLTATINKYIRQAAPVASEEIAQEFDLSSATIRNIFAELEEGGYLTHPYTSGGRIPTRKGYRYYVDFLVEQIGLLEEEKNSIIREYHKEINHLEDALEKTSELICTVTHYTGIVSFIEWHNRVFYKGIGLILDQPEFRDVEKMRLLIKMIEDKQRLLNIVNRDFPEKVKVYIGEELGFPEMDNCSLVVSSYRIKNKPSGRVAALGPMRMEYNHIISTLDYISQVLTDTLERF